jgi:hypothetical protein
MDFFTQEVFEESVVATELLHFGGFVKERLGWRTILGTMDGVKFSLFYYEYPLIAPTLEWKGIRIAQPQDIAAMKLLAISDRGARRDFIDLYMMKDLFPLTQVFEWYGQKFGNLEERRYHLLRGLSYFADAENQPMPNMFVPCDWESVKKYFESEVATLTKKWGIGA